jgi:hypothetical protein
MKKISTLRDLTIQDFIMVSNIIETFENDETKIRNEMIKHFKLEKLSIVDTDEFLSSVNEILTMKPEFIQRFELDGVEYGFIPNLDNITTGEWIDIEQYQKDINNADKLVSIFYRPIKRSLRFWDKDYYSIKDYQGTNNKLRQAPLEVYLGAMVFFYHLGNSLSNHLSTCISRLNPKEKQIFLHILQNNNLQKNLDGIQ